jgi:hypothetical protein
MVTPKTPRKETRKVKTMVVVPFVGGVEDIV